MSIIRDRLKEKSPELYEALNRSWEIAKIQWLPSIQNSSGSFNSYPHVVNLERYLDHVITEYEKAGSEHELTDAEIYVTCASILFHDMGRSNIKRSKEHGTVSKEILLKDWAILGIPSKEFAETIGDICESHKHLNNVIPRLSTVSISPYGKIRKRGISGLLRLLDQMDSTFKRIIPEYLRFEPMGAQGQFRACIKDVYVNPRSQTLCTVLDKMKKPDEGHELKNFIFWDIWNKENREEWRFDDIQNKNKWPAGYDDYLKGQYENPHIAEDVFGEPVELSALEIGVAKRHLLIKEGGPWESTTLLAVILSDLINNISVLDEIRDDLAKLGIRIRKWRLEYDEHLYDEKGMESYEGILFSEYLIKVIEQTWNLSTQIFGSSELTYKNLAAVIPEADLEKVKSAVKRLSIMSKRWTKDKEPGILTSQKGWKWRVNLSDRKCDYMLPNKLSDMFNDKKK